MSGEKIKIVCLCGSTRFFKEFAQVQEEETLAGHIVLTVGSLFRSDDDWAREENLSEDEYARHKLIVEGLHMRKVAMSDEVVVVNPDGSIGESLRLELALARGLDIPVRWRFPANHT